MLKFNKTWWEKVSNNSWRVKPHLKELYKEFLDAERLHKIKRNKSELEKEKIAKNLFFKLLKKLKVKYEIHQDSKGLLTINISDIRNTKLFHAAGWNSGLYRFYFSDGHDAGPFGGKEKIINRTFFLEKKRNVENMREYKKEAKKQIKRYKWPLTNNDIEILKKYSKYNFFTL